MKPLNHTQFNQALKVQARELAEHGVSALSGLFDITAPRILRYSKALMKNQDDAEDALQATLLKLAKHPSCLQDAKSPWAYLLRITRNEAMSILLKKKSKQLSSTLPDIDLSLCDLNWQVDLKDAIEIAFKNLSPQQKEVIVLKIWEGLTLKEIALVLEVSPNTVASRYRYALDKLKSILGEYQTAFPEVSSSSNFTHSYYGGSHA